ncbi:MAG: GNAT family N-acetyltransferase [Tenericutes bacterium]|jgi:ribosomal-protein-alanine N-acetyltransferase|nr:GNAT family N-acetyltransferase [Mycoplasmatota bacterium]
MIKEINFNDDFIIERVQKTFINVFKDHPIKKDLLSNPFSKYLVYLYHDKVCGFVNYNHIYERIEIINIEVIKEYQRQRIASKLISYIFKIKVNNITLEVKKNNIPAINLYKKFGFKELAIRKNYYNGVDGILMEVVD